MVNAGLTTFSKIEQTNPRELELVSHINENYSLFWFSFSKLYLFDVFIYYYQIVNRHPPFGNQIRESVIHLPKYEVILEQVS